MGLQLIEKKRKAQDLFTSLYQQENFLFNATRLLQDEGKIPGTEEG